MKKKLFVLTLVAVLVAISGTAYYCQTFHRVENFTDEKGLQYEVEVTRSVSLLPPNEWGFGNDGEWHAPGFTVWTTTKGTKLGFLFVQDVERGRRLP